MGDLLTYELRAFNTATASANKIHDDDVARRFGFTGGLVPGVDVYAYLCHLPAERWGLDWLTQGTIEARFAKPVYDGDLVTVRGEMGDDGVLTQQVIDPSGDLCATATAALPTALEAPSLTDWPDVEPRAAAERPPASPESLAPGTPFALAAHTFVGDRAPEYLADVREQLPLYTDERVAHPGWILRDANYVLSANVVLGPWIHVSSKVRNHRPVRDGEVVAARSIVTAEWEHKGHRFVTLDVAHTAGDDVVARVEHTAIHRPRQS